MWASYSVCSDRVYSFYEPRRSRKRTYKPVSDQKRWRLQNCKVGRRAAALLFQKEKLPPVVPKSPLSLAKQIRSISKLRFLHSRKSLKNKKMLVFKRKATT